MDKVSTLAAKRNDENVPVVIGIDLAKNVFAVHARNRHGKPALVKLNVRRDQLLGLLAQLPKSQRLAVIDSESCRYNDIGPHASKANAREYFAKMKNRRPATIS